MATELRLDRETAILATQLIERLEALASTNMEQFSPRPDAPSFDGIYRELTKQRFHLVRAEVGR